MTYLDMINSILLRLRERRVETYNQTDYSSLIGIFINDAVNKVETSWSWSALRTTLSASTVSSTFSYELNGVRQDLTVLDVINDTSNFFLKYKDAHSFNDLFLTGTPATGAPRYYSFNGVSTDGDTQVDLYPIPDGVYDLRFNVVGRSLPLDTDVSKIIVPHLPVELLAYAMAVEERGEDGGINPVSAFTIASSAMSDAIALDAMKHPEETLWVGV